jgi:hypothetical protein
LVGKPEGYGQLGRHRLRWEDHNKIDLGNRGCGVMDWIDLAQGRDQWGALVNTVMKLPVPQNIGKFLSGCETVGFPRRAQVHGVS